MSTPTELQQGSSGAYVAEAQLLLTRAGYPTTVDTIFGPETLASVTAFQGDNDLAVDGVVGPSTMAGLLAAAAKPVLCKGSSGPYVTELQVLLKKKKCPVVVDSFFGKQTKAAVECFQRSNKIGVDGCVGPITWSLLTSPTSSNCNC